MDRTEVQTNGDSLYTLLEISKTASNEEVRMAYKKAAKKTHPDAHFSVPGKFEEVNMAYSILANKKQRILYNMFGDNILPLLTEKRYSDYIDLIITKRFMSVFIVSLTLLLLCTVFYPYMILLAGVHVLPYFTLTLIPHVLLYTLIISIVYTVCSPDVKHRVISHTVVTALILVQCVVSALYIDGLISTQCIIYTGACTEAGYIASEVLKTYQYMSINSWLFICRRTCDSVLSLLYILCVMNRVAISGLLLTGTSPYLRIVPVSAYALVFLMKYKYSAVSAVLVSGGVCVCGALIVFLSHGEIGVIGWSVVLGMFCVSVVLAGYLMYKIFNLIGKAAWSSITVLEKYRIERVPLRV
ncbi:hypothetical protein NEPAR06_0955 [Nematocida parisii]|uniref:J domain-containing protein n=1 Tax=Nematocida parisii (strain ERTm3) TaxID=935791 RepID=I3EH87_NEMP3|nr:uncharacterized protein NEPG_00358 [Nematocida parisii ERTm1]EIJ88584.1 hypothetical protein NEQG_01274 [Nematocida parisii ERTm3]KAI5145313.1 hypothetical protein NEPAR07_1596 [Nematocida parisii]EIJ94834.1 hypothetical protein NEPG_00358 [Nematocida parisii ERTm1]KAI5154222.1 hypothetical protein NEPAR06_0955 [Nematocida parisii]KAI5157836.1 hypothetical protein NEPAR05_1635 [Nematocida parisii]|eukprot:XP_013058190.1 hypothetical protein NEPG_00358 [Nematocida parisii ERTm1]